MFTLKLRCSLVAVHPQQPLGDQLDDFPGRGKRNVKCTSSVPTTAVPFHVPNLPTCGPPFLVRGLWPRTATTHLLVRVLPGVRVLVPQGLDGPVQGKRDERPEPGPDPVDPVLGGEARGDDAGPEAAGRVQAAARVVDAAHLGDEEGEADADGGDEGGAVLLGREHEDGEDELEGQDRLDEDALREGHARRQGGADAQLGGEHACRVGRVWSALWSGDQSGDFVLGPFSEGVWIRLWSGNLGRKGILTGGQAGGGDTA